MTIDNRHNEGFTDNGSHTGTVKWFNVAKGYGFITPDEGGGDVFVHITAVLAAGLQDLKERQKVQYTLTKGRDGKISATDLIPSEA